MEEAGVKAMFERSVTTRKLWYTTYLGNGDSKSYQEVIALKPYPNHNTEKQVYWSCTKKSRC